MNIKNFAGKIFSKFCSATYAIERPVNYPLPMKIFHWGMVFGLFGTVGFVKMCQYTPKEDPKKWYYMKMHKSCGLVMGLCAVGRLMIRNKSVLPKDMPVTKGWHAPAWKVAKIAHYLLYCGMIFMPVTGIAMGIAGGKGVPFFDYFTIPGLPNE